MCLKRKQLKNLCKTYPNSYYVLKHKALLRRAFIRNSKILVEEEIKTNLSETLTKRTFSSKMKKKKEIEELLHKSHSVGHEGEFHFDLKPVEIDEFEREGSVAFEKASSESQQDIRELPEVHPGKMMGGGGEGNKKKATMELKVRTKKFKENFKRMDDTKTQTQMNDLLDQELKKQNILHKLQILKVFLLILLIFSFKLHRINWRNSIKTS